MHDGDFFGEIALVTEVPRTTTVTAETPVRLLVLTKRDFQRLMREQPQIQRKVLEVLARRLAPETL
jgi:CRP-like cAMP-binding protein